MDLRLQDLDIDTASLGNEFLLTQVMPYNAYINNARTDTVEGYIYIVCLPKHNLAQLKVKIAGKKLLDSPVSGFVSVTFEDLVIKPYFNSFTKKTALSAKAKTVKTI